MKKTINKTAAFLLTGIIAATSGICAVTQSAGAAENNKAIIHITSQNIDDYHEHYYGFKTGTITQNDVITANVGDVLEVVVYAQTKDPQHPKFSCAQASVFFSTDSCVDENMRGNGNGVLEFCDDYYDPQKHIITKAKLGGIINPFKLEMDDPSWVRWYEKRQNMINYNFSDIYLVDFGEPTEMFRFTVRVAKAGECYINSGVVGSTCCEIVGKNYIEYDSNGANLHTEVNVVRNAPEQIIKGDVDGDGTVTILDATIIQRYLAEFITFTDEQTPAADMDNNGKIGIEDVTAIQVLLMQRNPK